MSLVKIRWQGFHPVTRLLKVSKDAPFLPTRARTRRRGRDAAGCCRVESGLPPLQE